MERKLIFWNVAGILKKNRGFWKFIMEADFVSLAETWIEAKDIRNLNKHLPKEFEWKNFVARREHKKGRARGVFLIGIKKEWIMETEEIGSEIREGLIKSKIMVGKKKELFNIWSVYSSGNFKEIWQQYEENSYTGEGKTIIMGDFNIRIGEGKFMDYDRPGNLIYRNSKDKVIGKDSLGLIEKIEGKGWKLLNGSANGDEEGEFTFIGSRGSSVIYFAIVNEEVWEKISKFKVVDRVESDHKPICLELVREEGEIETKITEKGSEKRTIEVWNDESIAVFKGEIKAIQEEQKVTDSVEKRWRDIKEIIKNTVPKKGIKIRKWKIGMRRWWDRECSRLKRKAKTLLKRWKEGIGGKVEYLNARKEWKEVCKEKKKARALEEEEELKEIKNERQVWTYFNKFRKRREVVENNISAEEWKEHFRCLLEGSDDKKVGQKRVIIGEKVKEEKITVKEMESASRNLKKKKAAGLDGITNEVWIHGGEGLNNKLTAVIGKIWDGEKIPEDCSNRTPVQKGRKGGPEEL